MKLLLTIFFLSAFSTFVQAKCNSDTIGTDIDGYAEVNTGDPQIGTLCFRLFANRMNGRLSWVNVNMIKASIEFSNENAPDQLQGENNLFDHGGPRLNTFIFVSTEAQSSPSIMMFVSTSVEANCSSDNCGPFRIWFTGMVKGKIFQDGEFIENTNGSKDLRFPLNHNQIDLLSSLAYAEKAYVDFGEGEIRLKKSMQDAIKETILVFNNHTDQLVER